METGEKNYILYGESTVLILLFIAGLAANIPVLIVYFRSKHIRSITDKFLMNLLIADLISVALLFPSILMNFIQYSVEEYDLEVLNEDYQSTRPQMHGSMDFIIGAGQGYHHSHDESNETDQKILSEVNENIISRDFSYWSWSCGISNGVLAGLATASVLAALEIAMERYLAVVTPLHYHKFLTTPSIFITSFIGGVISIGSAVIASFDPTQSVFPTCMRHVNSIGAKGLKDFNETIGHDLSEESKNHHLLHGSSITNYFYDNALGDDEDLLSHSSNIRTNFLWSFYTLTHVTIFFIIPVILMTYIYLRIYVEARRQKIRMAKRYKPYFLPVTSDHLHSEDNALKGKNKFHPIFVRFKLMDRLRATRVDRAARVAVFTLFVTIICWCPYYFVRGSNAFRAILAASGSQSLSKDTSLDDHQYHQQKDENLLVDKGDALAWIKWECVLPLLCASLHPLLGPIFYAYRYKRLRTEIIKAVRETIPSCIRCDKSSMINKGFNTTSTTSGGGNPCIRQVIISTPPLDKTSIIINTEDNNCMMDCLNEVKTPILSVTPPQPPTSGSSSLYANHGDYLYEKDSHISSEFAREENHTSFSVAVDRNNESVYVNLPQESHHEDDGLKHADDIIVDGTVRCSMDTGGVVVAERSVGNFVNCLTVWMNSYSRRWLQHRESVTSTASFITLISSKYHSKANPVANV